MDLDHLVNSLKVKQGYAFFHKSNTPSREGFRVNTMRVRMVRVYLKKRCVSPKTASRSLLAPYRLYLQELGQDETLLREERGEHTQWDVRPCPFHMFFQAFQTRLRETVPS